MNFFALSSAVNGITAISLGSLVLYKKPKLLRSRTFFLFWFSVFIWSFCYFFWQTTSNPLSALRWAKGLMFGAILLPVFLFHYTLSLLNRTDQKGLLFGSYALCIGLALADFSDLIVARVRPKSGFPFWPDPGPLFHLHLAIFIGLVFYSLYLLMHDLAEAEGDRAQQLKYSILGTVVGFAGGMTNYFLCYDIPIKPYGNILVSVYTGLIAYTILKYRLMDINVVIRKTVVYALVTGIVAAIMVFVAILSARLTEGFLGRQTLFALALVACFITAVIHPLQLKVQAFVDRYFFRSWSDREVVREVAAGFSHELKSPLAGLSLQVQTTLAKLDDIEKGGGSLRQALPEIKADLQYLLNKTMDAARRIDAVRGVAEPTGGQIGPVDISSVLDSGLATLGSRLDHADVSVRKDLPHNLPAVNSNEKQLEIVFINLMKNALESMEIIEGGRPHTLSLMCYEQNGSVMISVKDTGAGISRKDMDRLFDPYFTTKGRRGTGMGLYLSQQIIKAHGGSIVVKSEEGKGTEFIVRLPIYSAEAAA